MTIKEIINNIRLRINDDDGYRWSDDRILVFINEAVRFVRNVFVEEMPNFIAENPINGELKQGENIITVPFDVIKYVDVRCDGKPIHAVDIHYITDIKQVGIPDKFVVINKNTIGVYPIPNKDAEYRIVAIGASKDLVETDSLPFQSDYQDSIIEYVSMRLSMIDEYDQSMETQLLAEIRNHIKAKLNNYAPQYHTVKSYY